MIQQKKEGNLKIREAFIAEKAEAGQRDAKEEKEEAEQERGAHENAEHRKIQENAGHEIQQKQEEYDRKQMVFKSSCLKNQ